MELRKRRGLMITLIALTIGLPTLFLVIKLLLHAFVPQSYGPATGRRLVLCPCCIEVGKIRRFMVV